MAADSPGHQDLYRCKVWDLHAEREYDRLCVGAWPACGMLQQGMILPGLYLKSERVMFARSHWQPPTHLHLHSSSQLTIQRHYHLAADTACRPCHMIRLILQACAFDVMSTMLWASSLPRRVFCRVETMLRKLPSMCGIITLCSNGMSRHSEQTESRDHHYHCCCIRFGMNADVVLTMQWCNSLFMEYKWLLIFKLK